MATSDTDICNMAISFLGGNKIIDITDETPEAELCRLNYDAVRDAALEDVDWTFAIQRYRVGAELVDTPVYGYAYSYQLQPEIIRILDVNDNEIQWVLEHKCILCDSSTINYRAIVRVENPALFSAGFVQAFAARLAMQIALPLTNSVNQFDRMTNLYALMKKMAQANDGRQGKAPKKIMTEKFRR